MTQLFLKAKLFPETTFCTEVSPNFWGLEAIIEAKVKYVRGNRRHHEKIEKETNRKEESKKEE